MNKFSFFLLMCFLLWKSHFAFGQVVQDVSDGHNDTELENQALLQSLEGIWISDIYCTYGYSGLPYFILVILNGNVKLDMIGYGYAENLIANSPSEVPKEMRTVAQKVEDVNSSLYALWCSERVRVPDQAIVSGLSQTGADVAYEFTKQGMTQLLGDTFLGGIGSNLLSGVFSDVVSNMIGDAFKATRRINILEMTIHPENEYELTAHANIQEIKIKGENKPVIDKEARDIHFTKYDPASGVFFDIPSEQKIYVPGDGLIKEIPKRYKEIGKSYLKYYDLRVPTHISEVNMISNFQSLPSNYSDANPFNIFQIKKLQYYNEQRALNLGYDHYVSKAYLGAQMQIKEDKKGKKGCYVYKVFHSSPAYLFDIQEGDYLLSIDGFDIDSPEQAEEYIQSLKPFDWVKVRLKRGKKTIEVDVELS